jgi:hypothetical protein
MLVTLRHDASVQRDCQGVRVAVVLDLHRAFQSRRPLAYSPGAANLAEMGRLPLALILYKMSRLHPTRAAALMEDTGGRTEDVSQEETERAYA